MSANLVELKGEAARQGTAERDPIITPFVAHLHLDSAVRALPEVRAAHPTYPPPQDVGSDGAEFAAWLMAADPFARWVAVHDGQVVGHVLVEPAHRYLRDHLGAVGYVSRAERGVGEIGKFFVRPSHQRTGVGRNLFRHAIAHTWATGRQPALAVVATSHAAIRFYHREGLRDVGGFDGVHGENRVFLHEQPSA